MSSIRAGAIDEGRWELLERVDDQRPVSEVVVGEHGSVALDLPHLLGD